MKSGSPSTKSYVVGFIYSVILTLTAYYLVVNNIFTGWNLAFSILTLAVIQLAVQLFYFLHLKRDKRSKWNMITFLFAVMVVLIVVLGSIWIMINLSYHHGHQKTSDEVERYIQEEEIINKKDLR
jgi:cytochrome o ubiquinol oxidase operon protein cyoD